MAQTTLTQRIAVGLLPSLSTNALKRELPFFLFIAVLVLLTAYLQYVPSIAMWAAFAVAGYSAIANDSVQTLGTFISSNRNTKWWILWIYIGSIMAAVLTYGWITYSGDISFGRLQRIPQAEVFNFYQLLAPIVLLVLTRLRVPLSTSFLLLAAFSSQSTITAMMQKTFVGYLIAFAVAIAVWAVIGKLTENNKIFTEHYSIKKWRALQWISTGLLWASWLMQDLANPAVFLPRSLTGIQFGAIVTVSVLLLGYLLYTRGGRIQEIVTEKIDITSIRSATIIDFIYAIILLVFKEWNNLPMSTTWVFLGLLAGREIALTHLSTNNYTYRRTLRLVSKDIVLASIGLIISLIIANLAQSR